MWFFRYVREQVKAAVIGGFRDAAEELELDDEEVRRRLALGSAYREAPALPPADDPAASQAAAE